MTYIVSSQAHGAGSLSQRTDDVNDALRRARQMSETGLIGIQIKDNAGNSISGDDLVDCIEGRKTLTPDLKAV